MKKKLQIGILGVGNLLMADEGFGVHCIDRLRENYIFPDNVELLDGGTAGIMLAPFIEDKDILFVIDVVNLRGKAGSIHEFSHNDVTSGNIQSRMSPHQVGLLEILDLCRLREKAPERVEMITVIPADLSTRIGLSENLGPKIDKIIAILLEKLLPLGAAPKPV